MYQYLVYNLLTFNFLESSNPFNVLTSAHMQVSRDNEDEETALMDLDSEDSDSGEGSAGVSGDGGGGRMRVEVDLTEDNKENNSDEELINL